MHYSQRHKYWNISVWQITLRSIESKVGGKQCDEEHSENEDDNVHEKSATEEYQLKGGYILKKRSKSAVLRYIRYNIDKDRENHFR